MIYSQTVSLQRVQSAFRPPVSGPEELLRSLKALAEGGGPAHKWRGKGERPTRGSERELFRDKVKSGFKVQGGTS